MKKTRIAAKFLLAILILLSQGIFAQEIPDVPNPPRLVNDLANVLSDQEETQLEQKLISWSDSTSNQMAIVLVKSLEGMDVADYAVRLAEKWKIGTKQNNGLLLLVAMEERKSRIEVGYGLESRITDAISRRILADYLKPAFKESRYYEGLDLASTQLIEAAAGEFKGEPEKKHKKKKGLGLGFIILLIIILYIASKNKGGGGGGFLTGMLLGNMLSGGNRHRGGGWGDFSSGSGSFGGFGGGSFGGGGSSGDW